MVSDKGQTNMPPVMILCGGQGTRLRDVTELLPKPMVPVGPNPIVWHIMKGYAAFGVKRFILCLGYKREAFIDYFLNYHARAADVTIRLGKQSDITYHAGHGEEEWEVTLTDTGDRTMTGGRIGRAAKYLRDDDREFFLTYGDAVSDIDFSALLNFHRKSGKILTVSAVHPAGRFGELNIGANGDVVGFHEKPQTEQGFINGGFMVANRSLPERYLSTESSLIFEQEPMRAIQKDGQMAAYPHQGFWQCMDTAREHQLLTQLWDSGKAPWTGGWK
ncbi:MAG: glucose-1-phosphate cytidylyltransferase [Pontiellaceae bacterium]|jgi:glucose-1-phosphate cytidylyltransferase|nr:glucose-1-phosphate cytidylyltransferase [Pontiellaceae bacterium]